MTYQHRIQNIQGYKVVMGQQGRGRSKRGHSRKQPTLPPSGTVVPEIDDRSKTAIDAYTDQQARGDGEASTLEAQDLRANSKGLNGSPTLSESVEVPSLLGSSRNSSANSFVAALSPPETEAKNEKTKSNKNESGAAERGLDENSVKLPEETFNGSSTSPPPSNTRAERDSIAVAEAAPTSIGFRSISWTQVTGSYRRERSIEGLLVGAAVGDALGLAREGLTRRAALSMFGRESLEYRLIPGFGIVSDDTHRMLITVQAMLRSRSQLDHFRGNFAWRLRWYLLTAPVSSGAATLVAALRLWMGVSPEGSGVPSLGNGPLISALSLATVLQGTGHSVERWVTASTKITHNTPSVSEASILVAHAAHMALMVPKGEFSAVGVMGDLIALTEETSLNALLSKLLTPLSKGYSVPRAAKTIGFGSGVPGLADATAVMAVYAWLRHHTSYRKAVTAAIRAGGDSDSLGALVGGFSGIHLGVDAIPRHWVKRVFTWPQNRRWVDKMTGRLTDWPHGSEDLHKANALPIYPIRQLVRSGILLFAVGLAICIRLPWQIMSWMERK